MMRFLQNHNQSLRVWRAYTWLSHLVFFEILFACAAIIEVIAHGGKTGSVN